MTNEGRQPRTLGGERPGAAATWYKAHGLGNDYLVFPAGDAWRAGPEAVAAVCHRQEGVGGDGIVVVLEGGPPFRLRMFNPDGGEFERSGNGLRVTAAWLRHAGLVGTGAPFDVEVGGDRVAMEVHAVDADGSYDVSAAMGRARTGPGAVALAEGALDAGGRLRLPDGGGVAARYVSVGNPHCVVILDEQEPEPPFDRPTLDRLGPALATHDGFAHGTNVQLVRVLDRRTLEILIWERGVGHTTASGTSSCAVAVAAVAAGRADAGDVTVRCEGGELYVGVTPDLDVTLRGPVREVAEGRLAEGFLRGL